MLESIPKPEAYRTTQQIGELQVKIEMTVHRILKNIDEAQKKMAALKLEIANRWKHTEGISAAERTRLASHETASRAREIINAANETLNVELKNVYGLYKEVDDAKVFYPSKLQFLMNTTLGAPERGRYASFIASAGPAELLGYATHAVATQDAALGAAVLQANDALFGKNRRFASVEIASQIVIPAWDTLQTAFKYANTQFQQGLIAVRVFKASRPSPVSTVHLAMLEGKVELDEDGSIRE